MWIFSKNKRKQKNVVEDIVLLVSAWATICKGGETRKWYQKILFLINYWDPKTNMLSSRNKLYDLEYVISPTGVHSDLVARTIADMILKGILIEREDGFVILNLDGVGKYVDRIELPAMHIIRILKVLEKYGEMSGEELESLIKEKIGESKIKTYIGKSVDIALL